MSHLERQSDRVTRLLSLMMFLQFFTWGTWFATMGATLDHHQLGPFLGRAYESAPIAAIVAPLFLGLIADRFFASERIFGILMLMGGCALAWIPIRAASGTLTGEWLVRLVLLHMLCYMPTLSLGNTIAFTHIVHQDQFPKVRVWGTIGWIVAGLMVGQLEWSTSFNIFWLGAASSVGLGCFAFFLPHTPPPLRGRPLDVRTLLMADAWKLLTERNYLVFAVCSMLICVPLAYYFGKTSSYLAQVGFAQPAATMTLGQMSEIFFMLLIPFFFRRLGLKTMILIGMASWVVRYGLFAAGAPAQISWMLLLAVGLHGICYDFFFVTGFMYTDQKASVAIRGQAQGLLVLLTQGIGMFFGYRIMAGRSFLGIPLNWQFGPYGQVVTSSESYTAALTAARGTPAPVGFFESFATMFSRQLPENLDRELLARTMQEWQNFWIFPALLAGIVMIAFAVAFWDRATPSDDNPTE